MSAEFKINSNLFTSLNEIITNPFMLVDNVGNVLSFNKEAGLLFQLDNDKNNIYDKFDDPSAEIINKLIEKLLLNQGLLVRFVNLKLKSGLELSGEVQLNIFNEHKENFVLFSFKKRELKNPLSLGEISIQIDIRDIIHNKDILKAIEEIRTNYPFSLIGRDSFRKKIDKLEEPFWIEDVKGNYIIVNSSLSKETGFKTQQMEGKPINNFLLPVLNSLYESINNYIKDSDNSILIKGVPFKGMGNSNLYETIKYPLFDSAHKFILSIGVTQKIVKESEDFRVILNNYPNAAAYINTKEEINGVNDSFTLLLNKEPDYLINKNFKDIFPTDLVTQLKQFQMGNKIELKVSYSGKFDDKRGNSESFNVYLSKIYNKVNEPEGLLIFIEKDSSKYNFENLTKNRENMLDILVQNNPDPIFIYDIENLGFLEVNNAALNLYGYSKEEFLKMDFTDLYSPEDIQTLLDSSNSPDKFGKFTGPYKHKKKDGSSIFVEISKFQYKFDNKDTHFNIIRDVTQKLESDKEKQLYKTAFDNSQNLLFVTDITGFITYVNQAVLDKLGYSRSDIEKNTFISFVKNEDRSIIMSSIFQTYLPDPVSLDMELKKADGSYIQTLLTATPILNYKNEIDSFTILGKAEQQIVVKEIVKEVIKESEEKPVYNTDIQFSSPAKKEIDADFLSSMFHEILTPINVIIGFVQELTGDPKNITAEQKEATEIINQNRTTLLNTMNSIIEFASIEKDNYEIKTQNISITEIIDFLQKDIEELSNTKSVEFAYGKISSSLKFESDKPKFEHLISLLLGIVSQLTKDKKIYFSAYQVDQEEFVISIRDNYSYVSAFLMDNLKSLFESSGIAKGKDFGISRLTIKLGKQLLRLLNGKFEILSKGEKADYGFVFPLKYSYTSEIKNVPETWADINEKTAEVEQPTVDEPSLEKPASITPTSEKPISLKPDPDKPKPIITEEGFEEVPSSRIIVNKYNFWDSDSEEHEPVKFDEELVNLEKEMGNQSGSGKQSLIHSQKLDLTKLDCLYLEDQVDSQILFKVQMKDLKSIKYAASFEEALPLLDNDHFDFLVVDINLQGEYNGLDVLKIVRKMPEYMNIPLIAVTAYVLPGDKEKFIAAGFNDFISKPIFREKMIDSLERILG